MSLNFKNYFHGISGIVERLKHSGFSPSRDWFYVLVFMFVLGFGWVCVNAFMFLKVYRGEIFNIAKEGDAGIQVIKRVDLQNVVDDMVVRNKRFESMKVESVKFSDPAR